MAKHKKARKEFESFFPLPDGIVWDSTNDYYSRTNSSILLGDCMKWDRMLQVWLTAAKHTTKQIKKSLK